MSHHHDQVHHHESPSDSPRAFARTVAVTIALVVIKALGACCSPRGFCSSPGGRPSTPS